MPVQIHNGSLDRVTPARWADDAYRRLVELGKSAELFIYPNQEHAFTRPDWELFMERSTAFFDEHVR